MSSDRDDKDMTCPECGARIHPRDRHGRDIVCPECGYVVDDQSVTYEQEPYFGSVQDYAEGSRTTMGDQVFHGRDDFETVGDFHKYLEGCEQIDMLVNRHGLESVSTAVKRYWYKIILTKVRRNNFEESLIAAFFLVSKYHGLKYGLRDLCEWFPDVSFSGVSSQYIEVMDSFQELPPARSVVVWVKDTIDGLKQDGVIGETAARYLFRVSEEVHDAIPKLLLIDKTRDSFGGAIVALACDILGLEQVTRRKIADLQSTTTTSMMNHYKSIKQYVDVTGLSKKYSDVELLDSDNDNNDTVEYGLLKHIN